MKALYVLTALVIIAPMIWVITQTSFLDGIVDRLTGRDCRSPHGAVFRPEASERFGETDGHWLIVMWRETMRGMRVLRPGLDYFMSLEEMKGEWHPGPIEPPGWPPQVEFEAEEPSTYVVRYWDHDSWDQGVRINYCWGTSKVVEVQAVDPTAAEWSARARVPDIKKIHSITLKL